MWIKTTENVCVEIRKAHKDELSVFSSFTDVDGNGYEWSSGHPEILTEWGFKNAEDPLYKVVMKKESSLEKEWKYEYFLYCT